MKHLLLLPLVLLSLLFLYGCGGYVPSPGQIAVKSNSFYPAEPIGAFIQRVNRSLDEDEARQMALLITRESRTQGIDPRLVASLIAVESRFDTRAVSSSGAKGLGQLKDATAASVGIRNPFDAAQNIRGTCRYIGELSDRWGSHPNATELTLASYNIGPGEVKRRLASGTPLPDNAKTYVSKIMAYFKQIQ